MALGSLQTYIKNYMSESYLGASLGLDNRICPSIAAESVFVEGKRAQGFLLCGLADVTPQK